MFENLLEAEKRLLETCQKGELLNLSKQTIPHKKIRGEFLRWLILNNTKQIRIDNQNSTLTIDPRGVRFDGAQIIGEFDFSFCETHLPFYFTNSTFQKKINLSDSKIRFLTLRGSSVLSINAQRLICKGSVFLDETFEAIGQVNFGSAQIGKKLVLSELRIKGDCILSSAKVDSIKEDEMFWEKNGFGKLYLDGLVYNHLQGSNLDALSRKKWLNAMPQFEPQPYKQLAKVLHTMGHHRDADAIMISYNTVLTKKNENKISFFLRSIYRITAGYGYKPINIFFTMMSMWLFCGTVYFGVSKVAVFAPSNPLIFQKKAYYECNVSDKGTPFLNILHWNDYNTTNNWTANTNVDGEYTTFSPFWYSLDILLPIVDLQMDKDWGVFIPPGSDSLTLNHVTRWLIWIEIIFGWIYSLVLVAILSGLAKNEKD